MTGPGNGFETELLKPSPAALPHSWWDGYLAKLEQSGIPAISRAVIEADARHVVERGVLGAGPAGDPRWPAGRVRTGAVMGAVQSGKTASMMAVSALALDAGVDAVVVLGGTRTALWLQTAERLQSQLDVLPKRVTRRVMLPTPSTLAVGAGLGATAAYSLTAQQAERAVALRRPVVAVVMKHVAHLAEMARTLHEVLYPGAVRAGRPFHVLVIDDEADDSSVVGGPESSDMVRQVPRRIRDLWEARRTDGETAHELVHATYLAYTATPQANFLQDEQNPLAPRDFFASLRTPGPEGDWQDRSGTYRVPEGARAWYTGGEVYYRTLSDVPLCVPMDPDEDLDEVLTDAVRGFLVASAVRVLRAAPKPGPVTASRQRFTSYAQAKAAMAGPMSMLVHPSAVMADHFDVAAAILGWAAGADGTTGRRLLEAGQRTLDGPGIRTDLHANRPAWLRWLGEYGRSADITSSVMDVPRPLVPDADDWAVVEKTIIDEVLPVTGVAVINSDERADDRPRFEPRQLEDGTWAVAPNLSTVFVSGNVMSRGLTLEGLTTTFFSRRSDEPLADTQMQMQRWFGYRGSYIDLCRVILPREQLELFVHYHENDEALRRDVIAAMTSEDDVRPPITVLQGRRFKATGKITPLLSTPLWPGPRPFVTHMNPPTHDEENLRLVADLFTSERLIRVPAVTGRHGLLLDRQLDLLQTADLLDAMEYVDHRPGRHGPDADRWRSAQAHLGLEETDSAFPLYRPRDETSAGRDLGSASPHWIAAYLRMWAAALERRVPGLWTTDEPPAPWGLVDLESKARQQPKFSVGLRFGNGERVVHGPLSEIDVAVHSMRRDVVDDRLQSTWGSRGAGADGIHGDEVFDLRARGVDLRLLSDGPRPAGSDGLVLFHVIDRPGEGVSLAVGVVIPLGGPDNIAAIVRAEEDR